MAAALIAVEHPGTTVVTDSITSDELTVYLEDCLGLKHLRFKRGYKNVINKSIALNKEGINSQLAIETSGHAAYKENYFLDDGAYLATKIVIKAARLAQKGSVSTFCWHRLRNRKSAGGAVPDQRRRFCGIRRTGACRPQDLGLGTGQAARGFLWWSRITRRAPQCP